MTSNINHLLRDSLDKSMSYKTYIELVNHLITEGKSTGHLQNEDMLNYSKLSQRRMKRWNKLFKLSDEDKSFFENLKRATTFLVISEGWCGDAAHALPIINKIAECSENITLKIVLRDDNDQLMQEFLTNGGKSIPKLIALDENLNVLFTWGPRSKAATKMVNDYKTSHGQLTPEFKEDLQKWYNQDKGRNIVENMKAELKNL